MAPGEAGEDPDSPSLKWWQRLDVRDTLAKQRRILEAASSGVPADEAPDSPSTDVRDAIAAQRRTMAAPSGPATAAAEAPALQSPRVAAAPSLFHQAQEAAVKCEVCARPMDMVMECPCRTLRISNRITNYYYFAFYQAFSAFLWHFRLAA